MLSSLCKKILSTKRNEELLMPDIDQSQISLNLRTVVTSWSYCSWGKWWINYVNDNSHRFKALGHISKTFLEAYTIFLSGKRIGSHIGIDSWNIQHILWLFSSFKQRNVGEILVGFQGRWTSIHYFLDSQIFDEVVDIFPRLSYRLTFIMLNSEVKNTCSTPGFHADMAELCYYFFWHQYDPLPFFFSR